MSRDPRAYLWDALQAARSIQRFTLGFEALAYSQDKLPDLVITLQQVMDEFE